MREWTSRSDRVSNRRLLQTVEPVKVKETDADCRASKGEGD